MMANTRSRTRLHMGCGETLSGRLVSSTDSRNANKLVKQEGNAKVAEHKHRQVANK